MTEKPKRESDMKLIFPCRKMFLILSIFSGFGGKNWPKYESDCGTSMDMHTAHSTEKGNEGPLSMSWLSRTSSLENDHSSIVKRVNNNQNNIDLLQDGTESRGSASSPKSYDSRSSVEDKVAKDIRQLPIPKTLKVKNGATGGSDSHDEDLSMEDDMSTGSRYVVLYTTSYFLLQQK
jgi:hypothetical protein